MIKTGSAKNKGAFMQNFEKIINQMKDIKERLKDGEESLKFILRYDSKVVTVARITDVEGGLRIGDAYLDKDEAIALAEWIQSVYREVDGDEGES